VSLQLLVNGNDFSKYTEQSNWQVMQQWSRQGATADFYLVDEHPDTPNQLSFVCPPQCTVVVTDPALGTTIFAGVCQQPDMKWEGPNLATWHLACRDWTILADMTIVAGDFISKTADFIIKALVAQQPCGLTTVNVMPGPVINRAKIKHQSLTSALKNVEQLASKPGAQFGYYIDENRDIHFYNQDLAPDSGITFTDDTVPDTTTLGHFDRAWNYFWDATSVRNDILLRGASLTEIQQDKFTGDGQTQFFAMTYVPDTTTFTSWSVLLNGVAKTLAIDNGQAPTTDFIVTKASLMYGIGHWWLQAVYGTPSNTDTIAFNYEFLQPVVTRVQDLGSISSMAQLPNGGHFQMYIADPTLVNTLAAKDRGFRELAEYSVAQERIEMEVTEQWPGHIRAGTLFTLINKAVPDFANSYYQSVILGDLPAGYWRLDDTGGFAADTSGNGHTGTLHGGITKGLSGVALDGGSSMLFDGTTGNIDIPYAASLVPAGAYSLELWLLMTGTFASPPRGMLCDENSAFTKGCKLDVNTDGTISLQNNPAAVINSPSTPAFGVWHHIVGTYDGANSRLYIDGVLVAGPTAKAYTPNDGGDPHIGSVVSGASNFFPGRLAECAIYTYQLSDVQVANHYAAAHSIGAGVHGSYLLSANTISGKPGVTRRYKITGIRIS